jgi:hypothetical protein
MEVNKTMIDHSIASITHDKSLKSSTNINASGSIENSNVFANKPPVVVPKEKQRCTRPE